MQYHISDLVVDESIIIPNKHHKITLKFKVDGIYACPANYNVKCINVDASLYQVGSFSSFE